jgi:hypothetical protein
MAHPFAEIWISGVFIVKYSFVQVISAAKQPLFRNNAIRIPSARIIS